MHDMSLFHWCEFMVLPHRKTTTNETKCKIAGCRLTAACSNGNFTFYRFFTLLRVQSQLRISQTGTSLRSSPTSSQREILIRATVLIYLQGITAEGFYYSYVKKHRSRWELVGNLLRSEVPVWEILNCDRTRIYHNTRPCPCVDRKKAHLRTTNTFFSILFLREESSRQRYLDSYLLGTTKC